MPPAQSPLTPAHLFNLLSAHFNPPEATVTPQNLRYVIYARKSTDDSEKQTRSLGDQISECVEYAEKHNLILGKPSVKQESKSAKVSDKREVFREVIDAIKAGKYDGIIAWHPDRLARNMKDAGEIIDLVDRGIIKDLRFVAFNFDNSPSGKMHLGITFVLAKQYSDHLSETVSRGIEHAIHDGEHINRPKHGYYKDREQRLRPDGRNFELIQEAFQKRLAGETFRGLAKFLNDSHYLRAVKDESAQGHTHKPFKWHPQMIKKVIGDPIYAGVVAYGDGHIANLTDLYNFVPAVSVDDFLALNKRKGGSADIAKMARNYRRGDQVKADLLRGIVLCAECHEPRSAGITRKTDGKNYFYYRCDTEGCSLHKSSTRAKVVIDFVNAFLVQKPFSTPKAYEHYVEEMKKVNGERAAKRKSLLNTLLGKQKALKTREQKLKDFMIEEPNVEFRENFRGDLLKKQTELKEVAEAITKTQALGEAQKTATLLLPEFLELMEKVAKTVANTKNMKELDFCIKKMFSNFSVDRKNVVNATLSEPFARLCDPKVTLGAR